MVIAGPRTDPGPTDLAALDAHLARGGAVLALFDPPTPPGWTDWMARYRVGLTGDVIVAADRAAAERRRRRRAPPWWSTATATTRSPAP